MLAIPPNIPFPVLLEPPLEPLELVVLVPTCPEEDEVAVL
jgi:hypothetical protein